MLTMSELQLTGKKVLIRTDFNVPIQAGRIMSDFRLQASLATIDSALQQGAAVIIVSHLGRPKKNASILKQPELSLAPVAQWLQTALQKEVRLIEDWEKGIDIKYGELVLLENIRLKEGETSNSLKLATQLAALCDIAIMDAFGVAHRAHSSTYGLLQQAPVACAGPLLETELVALQQVQQNAPTPLLAVIGGAKVSGKLAALQALSKIVKHFVVGGGIANTLLLASGIAIGQSFYEPKCIEIAEQLLTTGQFILPKDAWVKRGNNQITSVTMDELQPEDRIMDIGPQTQSIYSKHIQAAGTIIWNGPMGVFEEPDFATGTQAIAVAIAQSNAFSVVGGGDTLATIEALRMYNDFSLISTGGGAFLEYIQGEALPAIEALTTKRQLL